IKMVEREIAIRGDNTPDLSATLQNVSRLLSTAMKWAYSHGKPHSTLATRRWTSGLAAKVDEALSVAYEYSKFEGCFPLWHKNRYLAELLSADLARFIAPGTARARQASADQKGFRPKAGSFKRERAPKMEQTPAVRAQFTAVLEGARKTGSVRFEYDDPWTLGRELL